MSTIKIPIRTVYDSQNAAIGLAEFQTGEVVAIAQGGTSGNTVAEAKLNLTLTDSNIRSLLSVSGSGSYDNSTGIITVTGGVTSVGGATGTVSNTQLASSITTFGLLTTANVVELTNLYYTNARVYSNVVSIGYATNSNVALKANVADLTTANVTELNNLYFTNARVYSNVISIGYSTNANVALKANLTDKLNVFAATTSSELAGVISDETGSGALVFGTSPAITTSLTTGSSSFDLINTTATTVNFAKAATTLSIGAATGTTAVNNSLTVSGNLQVSGTTTTVNSTTLEVADKNITIAKGAANSAAADGAGITVDGASATFNYVDSTTAWTSSQDLNLASGKVYEINGTQILSSSGLGSGILASNLTSVGTITSGTWQGSSISTTYTDAKVTSVNNQVGAATGFATTANSLSQFTSTTSAQLATLISDETGTGNLVFNASPTVTGTITAAEITASGNVTSPFFYSQSDINLKKDLVHVTNALDIINQLDGYWFKWKSNDADSLGMIAQHVESVLPMLIGTSPDGSKTIQYNGIIAILLEAIKAQQIQIDEIKARLDENI